MAAEPVSVQSVPAPEQVEKPMTGSIQDNDDVKVLQKKAENMTLGDANVASNGESNGEGELHVACAEGKLEEVKVLLSKSVAALETLDVNTGCTPIVLAIRGNHHDVVKELLSAGAIVPPPGLTNDPLMLSILYPQPMYSMPPQFMGIPPPNFYPPPNYFPMQNGGENFPPRKESASGPSGNGNNANGQSNPNLPPAEVSKYIPCRNFPNCKYGASCVFFHPRPTPFYSGGPAQNGSFVPQGYENYPPYPPVPAPYFAPSGDNFHSFPPEAQQPQTEAPDQVAPQGRDGAQIPPSDSAPAPAPIVPVPVSAPLPAPNGPHVPSAVAPVFVPGYQPSDMMNSPPPVHFSMSPLSPSVLGISLPSVPPAEVFFATSPANSFMPPPMNGHIRQQSFGQGPGQFGGQAGKPFGHGKKPSFSNGKPFGARPPASKFGAWKDGNPPPCAFFNQGNCRNGEFCKFPHLDTEGNDCRHPDVVRGVLPPLPPLGHQKRNMRMMGAGFQPFDPAFRQQQYQQQMQFLQHQRMAAAQAQQGQVPITEVDGGAKLPEGEAEKSQVAPVSAEVEVTSVSSAVTLPPKPAAPLPSLLRSASQPGVQRVHANGFNSRSHSPASSNVSFHGNGHPRRAASRVTNAHAGVNGRSTSGGSEKKLVQRVPRADEFPVLGTSTNEKKEPVWGVNGKTVAQVLQAPAPIKTQSVKIQIDDDSASSKDGQRKQSVTMDSESESDAVIVSHKPSTATTPATTASPTPTTTVSSTSTPETKKPISFASVAGSSMPVQSVETNAVAVKA
ncbi:hypothetical protein L204_101849 [Cryptococcus depauperatus]|nr:hypothetical protein L204_05499 [Cryptococcus depauperatus CBS 7855]